MHIYVQACLVNNIILSFYEPEVSKNPNKLFPYEWIFVYWFD